MWEIEYNKRFLKELASLPKDIRCRIELIVFQELEAENPFESRYLEKLKGYQDKYKKCYRKNLQKLDHLLRLNLRGGLETPTSTMSLGRL
jgi:hypothetical protein